MSWPKKFVIRGCEARGDAHLPYLTRYRLLSIRGWRLCLHVFHRSDLDDMHDHPWPFWSLVLWGGYFEQTPPATYLRGLLSLARRPADWIHRVQLRRRMDGTERPCLTLVLMGRREKAGWGFLLQDPGTGKWRLEHFRSYFRRNRCADYE